MIPFSITVDRCYLRKIVAYFVLAALFLGHFIKVKGVMWLDEVSIVAGLGLLLTVDTVRGGLLVRLARIWSRGANRWLVILIAWLLVTDLAGFLATGGSGALRHLLVPLGCFLLVLWFVGGEWIKIIEGSTVLSFAIGYLFVWLYLGVLGDGLFMFIPDVRGSWGRFVSQHDSVAGSSYAVFVILLGFVIVAFDILKRGVRVEMILFLMLVVLIGEYYVSRLSVLLASGWAVVLLVALLAGIVRSKKLPCCNLTHLWVVVVLSVMLIGAHWQKAVFFKLQDWNKMGEAVYIPREGSQQWTADSKGTYGVLTPHAGEDSLKTTISYLSMSPLGSDRLRFEANANAVRWVDDAKWFGLLGEGGYRARRVSENCEKTGFATYLVGHGVIGCLLLIAYLGAVLRYQVLSWDSKIILVGFWVCCLGFNLVTNLYDSLLCWFFVLIFPLLLNQNVANPMNADDEPDFR